MPGGDENFVLQDEGLIHKYLGVNMRQIDKDSFELTQPFLIERITSFLGIADGKANKKQTPVGKPLLNKDLHGVPQKYDWEYRAAIGMLLILLEVLDRTLPWQLTSVLVSVLIRCVHMSKL